MKSNRFSAVLLITAGALTTGYMGCSSDDPSSPTGAGGATSSSVSSSRSSSSAHSSSRASSTGQVTVPPAEHLGVKCAGDADCGDQGQCLLDSSNDTIFGGGPAGGYCTAACEQDSDCEGPGSACFNNLCILGCEQGGMGPLDPGKCQGREDLACLNTTSFGSICIPLCSSDGQCPGRVCNTQSTVCADTAAEGLPQTSTCVQAQEDPCAGACIGIGNNKAACFNWCVLGAPDEVSCGGLDNGICAYGVTDSGTGDRGLCARSCTAYSDCQAPNFTCTSLAVPGRPVTGYCLISTPCPNGQAQCDAPTVCTQTPDGPLCLDPAFPPGGEGGAGGSGGTGGAGAGGSGAGGAGTGGSGGL